MDDIFKIIIDLFLLGTAKILLPIVSFGRWKVNLEKSKSGWLTGFPLYTKGDDGVFYFGSELGILFGVLFWILIVLFLTVIL